MTKYRISFLFIFLLLALLGCQKKQEVYFFHNSPGYAHFIYEQQKEIFEENHPDITLRIIQADEEQLKSALAANEVDVLHYSAEILTNPDLASYLLNIELFFSADEIKAHHQQALQSLTVNDRLIALPDQFYDHVILYYNQNLGVTLPHSSKKFKNLHRQLVQQDIPYLLTYNQLDPYLLYPFISGAGKKIEDRSDLKKFFDKKTYSALQFLNLLIFNKWIPNQCDGQQARDFFLNSKSFMLIDYAHFYPFLAEKLGGQLGVADFLPWINSEISPKSWAKANGYGVPKKISEGKSVLVKDWIQQMTSPAALAEWAKLGRFSSLASELNNSQSVIYQLLNQAHIKPKQEIYHIYFKAVLDEINGLYEQHYSYPKVLEKIQNSINILLEQQK
ncbi:MAG: ABC transporter substrate-binding protein [Spirochaetes bacterium]|nr:ABC transporter substrate-binding protein [Spirochaetota bacterium]